MLLFAFLARWILSPWCPQTLFSLLFALSIVSHMYFLNGCRSISLIIFNLICLFWFLSTITTSAYLSLTSFKIEFVVSCSSPSPHSLSSIYLQIYTPTFSPSLCLCHMYSVIITFSSCSALNYALCILFQFRSVDLPCNHILCFDHQTIFPF